MDMFSHLIKDHKKVKGMFEEALSQEEVDKNLANEICNELLLHMEKEEKFLYPEIQKIEAVKDLAEEAVEEHKEGKTVISAILKGKLSPIKLKVKMEVLQLEIDHHVEEEEQELFPKLKKLMPKEQCQEILEQMEALAQQKAGKTPVKSK